MPMVASSRLVRGSPAWETFHTPVAAASAPAIGVQRPVSSSAPVATAAAESATPSPGARTIATPCAMNRPAATRRINSSASPGPPCGNVENKRRNLTLQNRVMAGRLRPKPRKSATPTLSGPGLWSGFDDAALDADHRGVGAVVGSKFRENVLDPTLD